MTKPIAVLINTPAEFQQLMAAYKRKGWVWQNGGEAADAWAPPDLSQVQAVDFCNNFGYWSYFSSDDAARHTCISVSEALSRLEPATLPHDWAVCVCSLEEYQEATELLKKITGKPYTGVWDWGCLSPRGYLEANPDATNAYAHSFDNPGGTLVTLKTLRQIAGQPATSVQVPGSFLGFDVAATTKSNPDTPPEQDTADKPAKASAYDRVRRAFAVALNKSRFPTICGPLYK